MVSFCLLCFLLGACDSFCGCFYCHLLCSDLGLAASLIIGFYVGLGLVTMSPLTFLKDPNIYLNSISRFKCYACPNPNFGMELLARKFDPSRVDPDFSLSSVRVWIVCAEPVRRSTLIKFIDRFATFGFDPSSIAPGPFVFRHFSIWRFSNRLFLLLAFGMAESVVYISSDHFSDHSASSASSSDSSSRSLSSSVGFNDPVAIGDLGWALQNSDTDIRIVNPDACEEIRVGGQVGEIWVSSPAVSRGYWGWTEEANQAVFANHLLGTSRSFLRTGDLAFVRDGHLFFAGMHSLLLGLFHSSCPPSLFILGFRSSRFRSQEGSCHLFRPQLLPSRY